MGFWVEVGNVRKKAQAAGNPCGGAGDDTPPPPLPTSSLLLLPLRLSSSFVLRPIEFLPWHLAGDSREWRRTMAGAGARGRPPEALLRLLHPGLRRRRFPLPPPHRPPQSLPRHGIPPPANRHSGALPWPRVPDAPPPP